MAKLENPARSPERHAGAAAPGAKRKADMAWAVALTWYLVTAVALSPVPRGLPQAEGSAATQDVEADERTVVEDRGATEAEVARLRDHFQRHWVYSAAAKSEAVNQIARAFEIIEQRTPDSGGDILAIGEQLNTRTRIRLKPRELELIYKQSNPRQVERNLMMIVNRVMDSKLLVANKGLFTAHRKDFPEEMTFFDVPPDLKIDPRNDDPLGWPEEASRYLSSVELRSFYPEGEERPLVEALSRVLGDAMAPNLSYDQERTLAARSEAIERAILTPVTRVFEKGTLVARGGENLDQAQAAAMKRVNALRRAAYPARLGGVFLLTLMGYGAAAFYLGRLRNEVAFTSTNISLLMLPGIIAFIAGRLLSIAPGIPGEVEAALFPAALVGMLVTMFLGAQSGFVMALVTSLLFGVASDLGVGHQIVWIFAAFTAVISLQSVRARKDLLVAGLRVGMVSFVMVCILALFRTPARLDAKTLAWSLSGGVFSAMLAWILQEVFERVFGVVTDIRLLEITDPQHELLRQLEEKAPATFEHVLNVTKLAESAAEAIGANFLLVRAGAYFHDIGKMLKPKYFSENQVTLEDKKAHGKLSPYMSVLIIKNHVKEGIELARKHHLPPKIVDFIPEHHGTSLIRYFYAEALRRYESSESTEPVQEKDFRYPGPKPQSVESAIVMMADSVEATTTAIFTTSKVNENELRRVVGQTVTEKFNDGQFDECDLTMRDLSVIREAFVRTLKARYHQRIMYPTLPKREPAAGGVAAG